MGQSYSNQIQDENADPKDLQFGGDHSPNDAQSAQPLNDAQSSNDAQSAQPPNGAQAAQSQNDAQSAQPQNETQSAQPPNEAQSVQPPNDAQASQPENDAQSAQFPNEAQSVQPPNGAQSAHPPNEAQLAQPLNEALSAHLPNDAQSAQSPNEAQSAQPPNDAQSAQPQNDAQSPQPQNEAQLAQPLNEAQSAQPENDAQSAQPPNAYPSSELHFGSLNFKAEAFGTGWAPVWAHGPTKGLGVRGKCKNQACEVATSPYSCLALYSSQAEANYRLRGNLPLCPVCRVPFQPISLLFHDCDMSFTLKEQDKSECKEGPFHCPKGKWSVLKVRKVDPKFIVANFKLGDRPPELKEGMSNQEKREACQQMANEVVEEEQKIVQNFKTGLSSKEKLALRRQATEAAKADKERAKKLESAETDLKRVDKAVDDLKPLIYEAKTLADLDAPAEAIDRAKQEAVVVSTQRDDLVQEMKTEKQELVDAQNQHAAVMRREEQQLQEAKGEVRTFRKRAKKATKSLRSFFSRTFGEASKFLKAELRATVARNAGVQDEEKRVQKCVKAVNDLLGTLHKESQESKNIRDTLEQLRASLAEKEARVNDLSSWVGRVLVNLEALEAELDAKMIQLDE